MMVPDRSNKTEPTILKALKYQISNILCFNYIMLTTAKKVIKNIQFMKW